MLLLPQVCLAYTSSRIIISLSNGETGRISIRNILYALFLHYSPQPDSGQILVRGLVLLNCAGGMNNKAIVDDWRIKLLLPLLWLIDFLLNQKGIASAIFELVKRRYFF